MKKLLYPLLAAFAWNSGTCTLAAPATSAVAAPTPAAAPSSRPIIDIHTDDVSLVLVVDETGSLLTRHFGGRIADPTPFADLLTYRRYGHGSDEETYPAAGGRNFRSPALRVTHADGDLNTELRYLSHESRTLADRNVTRTVVHLADRLKPLDVELTFTAYARENVITARTVLRHREPAPVIVHEFYAPSLILHAKNYLLTHLHGGWAYEAQVEHTLLDHGITSIESRKQVRATHSENPAFMLTLGSKTYDEEYGEVVAGALAWSGNFRIGFEHDEFDALTVLAGANPYASEYPLAPGDSLRTPELILTHTFEGAGGASRNLHDWARRYGVWRGDSRRVPTLLNSWEGAYFDFDEKTLIGMIDDAAAMGLEMFVLDDGWFGNKYPRDNDCAGLGDWEVNTAKLPGGLDRIASYAHAKGLKFGIWIEPEMVNPRSELAEAHPDWIVRAAGREAPQSRSQWLLDLSNPAVQDFVFSVFDRTLQSSGKIDYVKWDANRHVENPGSAFLPPREQSRFWIDYTEGFYKVMVRIRAKYPDVLIQACSSGGGRAEYGALKYFNEIWTSDNTEARCRARIQYGTSLFYPASVMGAHVSAVPNHQSGNVTPLKFRFDMACAGRLGMELQPKQMSDSEKAFARRAVASYKTYRDIVSDGDLYRIGSPYDPDGCFGTLYVSKDKRRAVFFAYCTDYRGDLRPQPFRLPGLAPDKDYTVRELNVDTPRCWFDGRTLSGEYLRHAGLNPPLQHIYDSGVFLLEAR